MKKRASKKAQRTSQQARVSRSRSRRRTLLDTIRDRVRAIPRLHAMIGLSLLAVSTVAIVVATSALSDARARSQLGAPEELPYRILDARVVWTSEAFLVTNQSDGVWNRCKLELNAVGFGDGYSLLLDEVVPATKYLLPYSAFVRDETSVYDGVQPPTRFTIRCQDIDGLPGVYIGSVSNH